MRCHCGFEGVEIWFLRLDGGRGLSELCRHCQQIEHPQQGLCFWCLRSGATVAVRFPIVEADENRGYVHIKCLPDAKEFVPEMELRGAVNGKKSNIQKTEI